jgi:HSP20 family protein
LHLWSLSSRGGAHRIARAVRQSTLTIRGEKHAGIRDNDRPFTERSYGRFERRIALGFEAEDDKVSASFKNGVRPVRPA